MLNDDVVANQGCQLHILSRFQFIFLSMIAKEVAQFERGVRNGRIFDADHWNLVVNHLLFDECEVASLQFVAIGPIEEHRVHRVAIQIFFDMVVVADGLFRGSRSGRRKEC